MRRARLISQTRATLWTPKEKMVNKNYILKPSPRRLPRLWSPLIVHQTEDKRRKMATMRQPLWARRKLITFWSKCWFCKRQSKIGTRHIRSSMIIWYPNLLPCQKTSNPHSIKYKPWIKRWLKSKTMLVHLQREAWHQAQVPRVSRMQLWQSLTSSPIRAMKMTVAGNLEQEFQELISKITNLLSIHLQS